MMRFHSTRLTTIVRRHRTVLVAALALLLVLAVPAAARAAVTCTGSESSPTFGTINPYSGFPYYASGTGSYTCTNTGTTATRVTLCTSIGTGTGGTTSANRTLASGGSKIPIEFRGRADNPVQIGNGTSYLMKGPLTLSVPANGMATGTYTKRLIH